LAGTYLHCLAIFKQFQHDLGGTFSPFPLIPCRTPGNAASCLNVFPFHGIFLQPGEKKKGKSNEAEEGAGRVVEIKNKFHSKHT